MHKYRLDLYGKKQGYRKSRTFSLHKRLDKTISDLEVGREEFHLIMAHFLGLEFDPNSGDWIEIQTVIPVEDLITIGDLSEARQELLEEINPCNLSGLGDEAK